MPLGRRVRRHSLLALTSGALVLGVYPMLLPLPALARVSTASAYAGLALLSASLMLGPWNVLRGRPNPVSTDLRRDVGIWAGLLGLFHTVVGLQVHFGGRFWFYFLFPPDQPHVVPLRYDPFGMANFAGLGAACVLALLMGLSNNDALRRLGAIRWKALQRWNYGALALVAAHGAAYQLIEKRRVLFVGLFGALLLVAATMQCLGYAKRRRQGPK